MRILVTGSVLAVALLFITAGTARASTVELLTVKVPFPFLVNGHQLPAGPYRIQEDPLVGPAVMYIRAMNGHSQSAIIQTQPASRLSPAGGPAVTFTLGEKLYRLTGIWRTNGEGELPSGQH